MEVRPGDVDGAVERDVNGFMIGKLAVRASRFSISRERADQRERVVGTAGGPGAAAISRGAQPGGHVFSHISETGEVGRVPIRAERDRGGGTEVVGPSAGHGGCICGSGAAGAEGG